MATYYARNVTGNWSANTSWDSASSGGAGPAGPPIAGDTVIFDSGFTGNITVSSTCYCATLTVQAGATGTLTYGTGQILLTTANVTFASSFHLAGSGEHRQNGNGTLTSAGLTIPNYRISGSSALTLADALTIAGAFELAGQLTVAGAFDIACADFRCGSTGAQSHTFVAGQTLTVSNSLMLVTTYPWLYTNTVKSSSASSPTYLDYNGTAANCKVFGFTFTDIDASSSAQGIDNWMGGALTRTSNITNRTSADIGGSGGGSLFGSVVR